MIDREDEALINLLIISIKRSPRVIETSARSFLQIEWCYFNIKYSSTIPLNTPTAIPFWNFVQRRHRTFDGIKQKHKAKWSKFGTWWIQNQG